MSAACEAEYSLIVYSFSIYSICMSYRYRKSVSPCDVKIEESMILWNRIQNLSINDNNTAHAVVLFATNIVYYNKRNIWVSSSLTDLKSVSADRSITYRHLKSLCFIDVWFYFDNNVSWFVCFVGTQQQLSLPLLVPTQQHPKIQTENNGGFESSRNGHVRGQWNSSCWYTRYGLL